MAYTEEQINEKLTEHPDWHYGEDGQLHADYTFGNFKETMMFVNAVALLAEAANHHPDMRIYSYKNLSISLMSHDADAITDRDFDLAAKIDALPTFE